MQVHRTSYTIAFILVAFAAGYLNGSATQLASAQGAAPAITDKFATTILQGGCSIRIASTGQTVTTEGSGGACPTTVTAIVDHLAALNRDGMRVFALSENDDAPNGRKGFRFVVSFNAQAGTQDGDIFLSLLGTAQGMNQGFMEAMGFDSARKSYVYYHIASGRWEQTGDSAMVPLDSMPGRGEVAMECQQCHTTGAPLMRELQDPWANWQSSWDALVKPDAADPLFQSFLGRTIEADNLEPIIIAATKASASGRVDRAVAAKQTGLMLKQAMCDVGEPSLIAVHNRSKTRFGDVVTTSSMLPGAILLNQIFAAPMTGTGPEKGLDGNLQMNLPEFQNVKGNSAAYVAAAKKLGVSFKGMAGLNDAKFAWFSPEKSHADLAVVMELLTRNLVNKDVLADAMMVDFTTPMLSRIRCDLASTIPANFSSAEELRTAWIANLSKSELRGASGLKSRLEKQDDFADHEKQVNDYLKACAARSSEAADRFNEDVLTIVAQRRNEFRAHFSTLANESSLLLPVDNGSAETAAGTWRLSASKCELEKQTEKFAGE